jgi:hypothetical protein
VQDEEVDDTVGIGDDASGGEGGGNMESCEGRAQSGVSFNRGHVKIATQDGRLAILAKGVSAK